MHVQTASSLLDYYFDANIPIMMHGAPGIGKSAIVNQFAAKRNLPVIDLRISTIDAVDVRGVPHVVGDCVVWAIPEILPDPDRDGPEGIFFLDEINAGDLSTMKACYQLILDRKMGKYTMPPGWRIFAAGNRQSDGSAVNRMPKALATRLAHLYLDPDCDAWQAWALSVGLDPLVCAFLKFRPALLHYELMQAEAAARAAQESRQAKPFALDAHRLCTPRGWESVAKICRAPAGVRHHLVSSLVDVAPAGEFEAFVDTFSKLPKIADILANPQGAIVPTDIASMHAVTTALARVATVSNFGAILDYAARLGTREFEIALTVDATGRDVRLLETAAYVNWAIRNQSVTV